VYIRRLTRALLATLIAALIWPALAAATPPNADLDADGVTDSLESHIAALPDDRELRLIVSLDRAATGARVRALERAVGDMDVHQRFDVIDAVAVTAIKEQVRELAAQGVVDRVEQDLPVHSEADGDFSFASNDSAQASFGVTEARLDAPLFDGDRDDDLDSYTPDDLVAAVIDSGIDSSHVDLDGGKVLAFAHCIDDKDDPDDPQCFETVPYDDDGHGTHVAATLAGDGDGVDGEGGRYPGVAPGAGLVGVKVLDQNGDGFTSDVVDGIEWAVEHTDDYGIEAINLSLGTEGCGDGLNTDSQAVNAAWGAGLIVTVAAGNDGPDTCTIGSPGDAKDSITVGAMADLGANGFKLADFSGRGPTADGRPKPDVTAPGVGITSAQAGTASGFTSLNGTSMATPFVTGVALLMLDAEPAYTMDDVKDTLRDTAIDWGRGEDYSLAGSTGPDVDYGAGRLAAYAALAATDTAIDGETTLTSPPTLPQHATREGSLSGTGQVLEYAIDVPDTRFPLAATMIEAPTSCRPGANPDFDLRLTAPDGTVVATATSSQRQDELGVIPQTTGVYKLRVYSFRDCGHFFVDVSGGAVSSNGTSNPDGGDKPPPATAPPPVTTPSTPAVPDDSAAVAAVVDAARITARRAGANVRRVGLRRLLLRGRFTVVGVAPTAGRIELAVRMTSRGRQRIVARAVRRVYAAGGPRLSVRLTRVGRILLRRVRSARLTVRAAVTDSGNRRRYADRVVRVLR
jgi:serine protease AprX